MFKTDWEPIYQIIRGKFECKETPIAYHRIGDDQHFIDRCKEIGLELKEKEAGYRSIHYIAKISFFSTQFKCEIQIRTIFEEAWSEIDHLVRYPNNTDNELLNSYLLMFNKLSGYADDMGTFLMAMKSNLANQQKERNELESAVNELRDEISKLKGINKSQTKKIDELMKRVDRSVELGWSNLQWLQYPSNLDYIVNIQNPSELSYTNRLADMSERISKMADLINNDKIKDKLSFTDKFYNLSKIGTYNIGLSKENDKSKDNDDKELKVK